MKHIKDFKTYESMLHTNSLDQLKKVAKELDGLDIGKRVSDDSFANAIDQTKRDIITDDNVETYTQYMNEPFDINQNRKPWEERKKKD